MTFPLTALETETCPPCLLDISDDGTQGTCRKCGLTQKFAPWRVQKVSLLKTASRGGLTNRGRRKKKKLLFKA